MGDSQTTQTLQTLLSQSPELILHWLQDVESGHQEVSSDFNWLGLAESAAFEARAKNNVTWAEVAIRVYERLATSVDSAHKNGFIASIMHLKAFLIIQLGAVHGDPILDPDEIVQWFFANLPYTFEEATQKTAHWRTLDVQEIKALRLIKGRLSIVTSLVKNNIVHPGLELQLWLSLQQSLP
jgi:hypothetical protein